VREASSHGVVGALRLSARARATALDKNLQTEDETMSDTTGRDIGTKYVALCKEGKFEACFDLYAPDAVSVEAGGAPGMDRVSRGLDAIRAKGKWWYDNHTVHKAESFGPYPLDNRFAVRFVFDVTMKASNQRVTMDEVGLFTIENGKIVREEFFYTTG